MAQKQYTTFQSDILSFELREALLGIIRPGRFSGFDQIAADEAPAGGTIYLALSHSTKGVQKLAKLGSSFESPIGVALTTQGTIIHEDNPSIDIDIPDNSGGWLDRWYVIYLEHDYVEVQGANQATYGFVAGIPGVGIPALTEAYHRVPLGYIRAVASATSITGLTYFPANNIKSIGDDKINEILWGSNDDVALYYDKITNTSSLGVIPAGGVIGNRRYGGQFHVTDKESITASLTALDIAVNDIDLSMITLGNTKLDDWGVPDDNTDLNASTLRHGLLPKLSGDVTDFLSGSGQWYDITTYQDRVVWVNTPSVVMDIAKFPSSSGNLDFSALVPNGTKAVILDVYLTYDTVNTGMQIMKFWKGGYSAAGGVGLLVGNTTTIKLSSNEGQFTIPLSTALTIGYSCGAITHIQSIDVKLLGWVI